MLDNEESAWTVLCLELAPCSKRSISTSKNDGVPAYAAIRTLCATDDVVDGNNAAVTANISLFRRFIYDNVEAVFEELLGCRNSDI